jgi:hypothetical protein
MQQIALARLLKGIATMVVTQRVTLPVKTSSAGPVI